MGPDLRSFVGSIVRHRPSAAGSTHRLAST